MDSSGLHPNLIHVCWTHTIQPAKRHLDRFSRLCTAQPWAQHTDRRVTWTDKRILKLRELAHTLTVPHEPTTDLVIEALLLQGLVCWTLASDSLGDILKIIYLGFEKSQRSVTYDFLRYINILTYLLTVLVIESVYLLVVK